jgi:hypothetical protein
VLYHLQFRRLWRSSSPQIQLGRNIVMSYRLRQYPRPARRIQRPMPNIYRPSVEVAGSSLSDPSDSVTWNCQRVYPGWAIRPYNADCVNPYGEATQSRSQMSYRRMAIRCDTYLDIVTHDYALGLRQAPYIREGRENRTLVEIDDSKVAHDGVLLHWCRLHIENAGAFRG